MWSRPLDFRVPGRIQGLGDSKMEEHYGTGSSFSPNSRKRGAKLFMQSPHMENILCLLSLAPVHTSRPRHLFPPHWKSNQRVPANPATLGEQIKKHRLELHWLQLDVAAKIGISPTSVSNWERGITSPSRRMTKRIREFLDYTPKLVIKVQRRDFHCQTCGISNNSSAHCLFEKICNPFI